MLIGEIDEGVELLPEHVHRPEHVVLWKSDVDVLAPDPRAHVEVELVGDSLELRLGDCVKGTECLLVVGTEGDVTLQLIEKRLDHGGTVCHQACRSQGGVPVTSTSHATDPPAPFAGTRFARHTGGPAQ